MPGGHSPWQQERSISWTTSPPGAARSRKRAGDRRKSHGTGATSGLRLPARAPCPLAGRCTQRQRVMEETSAATGVTLLLPLLHAALAQATSAQPSPRSAGTLQQQGAGTQAQAPGHSRDSPLPCSGTTQHVMALRPGRYGGGRQQQMGGTGTARHARQHPPNPAPRLINAYRAFAPITPSPVSCQCETPA